MKKVLLAGAALAALATGAQAADLGTARTPIPAAVMAPAGFNWTGFYLGGQIGYGWGVASRVATGGFANSYTTSGVLGGIHAGYNWQGAGSPVVLGIVADIEAAGLNGNDRGVGGSIDRTRVNWAGSLRVNAGVAVDRALLYVTGGLAFGGLGFRNDDLPVASFGSTRAGWTVGAGLAYAFTPNWAAFVEYRYADFGRTASPGFPGPLPSGIDGFRTQVTTHTARIGVSYLFTTGGAVSARY